MIEQIVADTMDYLGRLDSHGLIRLFWFFVLFDLPRYILTDVYLFLVSLFRIHRSPRTDDFILRLRHDPPLVSIIIPALNEQDTIAWTIRSLLEQTYANLELIIVDDGSTDGTPEICRHLAQQDNISFYRFQQRAGKSAVLNYGLRIANGEFIVFVDSDSTFDRDAVFNLMTGFADPEVGGVAGNLRVRNGHKNILTQLQQIEYIFTISIGRIIQARLGVLPIISGAFGGFRKEAISLSTIGGHEPGPGNDSDITIRIRKTGRKIVFVPEANCSTTVPEKWSGLVKQRARWDGALVNRMRKHRDVFNMGSQNFRLKDLGSFVDPLFFNVVLSVVTVFYLVDMIVNFSDLLPVLIFINLGLYFCAELLELSIAVALLKRKSDVNLVLYLPLFNFYKLITKYIRMKAHCQELVLRYSHRDSFAPFKVRQQMLRW